MSASHTPSLSSGASSYVFHHVFLPPKLPQEDDYNAGYETSLLDTVICALGEFKAYVPTHHATVFDPVITMLARLRRIRALHGDLDEGMLEETLKHLMTKGGILPIHVRCQNAAVLMTKVDDAVHVEVFELSPLNKSVYSSPGRLQRNFPGPAFTVTQANYSIPSLRETIARTLAKMSHQSVAGTKPKVKKAGHEQDEERDTTNPMMVTEFFTAFLRPFGTVAHDLQIRKNTREEVLLLKNKDPWRRSPLWLLIRVAIQLVLKRLCRLYEIQDDLYKQFMVYYMSFLLNACSDQMPDESRQMMNSKISRRLHKLDLSIQPQWFSYIHKTLHKSHGSILKHWRHAIIRSGNYIDQASLLKLDFGRDVSCPMPDLDKWIESITTRERSVDSTHFQPQTGLHEFESDSLPFMLSASDPDYEVLSLAAFEYWVRQHLDNWLALHRGEEDTCKQLCTLVKTYFEIASPIYSSNPEAVSVMVLTVLELWIACDKSAIHTTPLLRDYDSCVPMDMVESFVLPRRSQMERLSRVEEYMRQRQQEVRFPESNIFQEFGTPTCFPVRYFDQSHRHQELLGRIEERARQERRQKQLELQEKHDRYRKLYSEAAGMECEYYQFRPDYRFDYTESRHSSACTRCAREHEADSISIAVHEWPLPASSYKAKNTVFEINTPRPFAFWRETTAFLLFDVLKVVYSQTEKPRARYRPQKLNGVLPYFTPVNPSQRIDLLSQTKPHEGTHRRKQRIINVTEEDVCLSNGLNSQYFDDRVGSFVFNLQTTDKVSTSCTYRLPQAAASLQKFLIRPANRRNGPSPNTVIAWQDACPPSMSLEEYKGLCSMPLGIDIQWENILRQLAMPSVVFNKSETCVFLLQILHQTGPSSEYSILRKGHRILENDEFTTRLLAEIAKASKRIEENWESAQELSSLILLTQRVMTLSASTRVREECLTRLSSLRDISFRWTILVREQAGDADTDERRNYLLARSTHLALICASTYDSDVPALERILQGEHDASRWMQCCMMIHDRKGLLDLAPGSLLQLLYHRWQIVAYRSYHIIAHNVVNGHSAALDMAIKETWAAYRPQSLWSVVPGPGRHWLEARGGNVVVHFNLLLGELLINGRPLALLPSEYERHETYKTLFGRSPIEVMPSELPGMDFSGQRKHMGQTIHLGKEPIPGSGGFDLCIRAINEKGQSREILPARLFEGAFPDHFVDNYAHWYDVDRGYVDFCPVKEPWRESSSHWRLQRNPTIESTWELVKGEVSLINIKSQTARTLSNILKPVEKASKLHFMLHTSSSLLEIDVPRFRLAFTLRPRDTAIHSRQYRGMVIDADQSLETLVGLHNRLVLIHKDGHDRKVLIPEGNVTWRRGYGHKVREIILQEVTNVHVYSVNRQLGQLADNGSLQSKLWLSYLHALTSFCLPDPLTKKTGTEQSLYILRAASTRSFNQLQEDNIKLLMNLANLTPKRRFYPENEREMQEITWQKGLDCLVQHDDFREQVSAIFDQDNRMKMFYPEAYSQKPLLLPVVDGELSQRCRIRSSTFRTTGFGSEDYSTAYDREYSERGRNHQSERCLRVFSMCKTLYNKVLSPIQDITKQDRIQQIWAFLEKCGKVHGPGFAIDQTKIRYDSSLLQDDPVGFVGKYWCSLHSLLSSQESRPNMHQMMIWLSAQAFADTIPMPIVETIAAVYVLPTLRTCMPPSRPSFLPADGYEMSKIDLTYQISSFRRKTTPESIMEPQRWESPRAFQSRIDSSRNKNKKLSLNRFVDGLGAQWPIMTPGEPPCEGSPRFKDYFNLESAMACGRDMFSSWYCNKELREYLTRVASVISAEPIRVVTMPSCPLPSPAQGSVRKAGFFCLDDVLNASFGPAPTIFTETPRLDDLLHVDSGSVDSKPRLQTLVGKLESQARSDYERKYVQKLQGSIDSLQRMVQTDRIILSQSELRLAISGYLQRCQDHSREIYNSILRRMTLPGAVSGIAHQQPFCYNLLRTMASIDLAPRFSPELFLQQLSRKRWIRLSDTWKACFIAYGLSITALQWARRLDSCKGHREDLLRELQNPGHISWDPINFPEALLLEVESELLIREPQNRIAQQMMNIQPGQNAVMQLNMGEGKSSVIVPVVAAALANGSCLVRVLVAKPQSKQMFHMLVSKLGGLLGRRVYHLPISRSLAIDEAEAREIERMCLECMAEGGVLLVQPEHILSLKLMCLECYINGKDAVGKQLLRVLELFQNSSRDVVDESDENFSVKFELIYTMGAQRGLELSPQRWVIIQQLLDLVRRYAPAVKAKYPESIEVDDQCPGSFPRTRFLHEVAAVELFELIGKHIYNNGIDLLPVSRQPELTRKAVIAYILKLDLSEEEIAAVEGDSATSFWTDSTREPLLLLRGLLANGVLASCLGQKRWRVHFGPDNSRKPSTKLSVPYHAKDNPAPRSEFSHPDVVIVLTCLSHYYGGLGDEDLFMAFEHLLKSDQAEAEYQRWVDDAPGLSRAYRQLNGINLQDRHHCLQHVFPSLRLSKGAIDYFLAHIVFPKEMKEFPDKLSASGWDIGDIKNHPTAGFSGTNDSRVTLPLSVTQLDLPEQNHTNALVLEYLLQPENSVVHGRVRDPGLSDAQVLLDQAVSLSPPTQVILDVGAQILELTNREVAETWLKMVPNNPSAQAVVFVNDSDEICVLDRTGLVELLHISPFAKHLESCLVFLDEAHTRGIDLKLPPHYRAAVTLGAGITKDKLVQACMRMRKLGKGQSVVFYIPQEIEAKILTITEKSSCHAIEVADVLRWAVSETWVEMQRSIPLWAIQGERYERQSRLWREARCTGELAMSEEQAEQFLEPESQSIEQRYRPRVGLNDPPFAAPQDSDNIRQILERCREFENINFHSTQLQEEQERQLAPEVEQERQVQRPPSATPEKHFVHEDLRHFVATGVLNRTSMAFKPAFTALEHTSAAKYLRANEFPVELLVTTDFAKTIQPPSGKSSVLDDYQRPVQWILTSSAYYGRKETVKDMVIISPFEANELRSEVLKSEAVMMHLYAPRQNRTFSPIDNLNLYTIPRNKATLGIPILLRIQLNLFAGQLYISSFQEYREICDFLGVAYYAAPGGVTIAADGFILSSENGNVGQKFSKSPLMFLKTLMSTIRKDGQEIDKTHLGRLLDGKVLTEEDFQD
ncbi:hypothetical protein BDV18DRAFT_161935 [Aspergillus unguis]